MRIIGLIIKIIILIALLLIAIQNTQEVTFNLLPESEELTVGFNLPLILLLLIAFIIGAFLGILSILFRTLKLRKDLSKLQTKYKKLEANSKKNQNHNSISLPTSVEPDENLLTDK